MQTDNIQIHAIAHQLIEQIGAKLSAAGVSPNFSLHLFCYSDNVSHERVSLHLSDQGFMNDKVEVKGKDIWAMVDEFIHRLQFDAGQKQLKIAPPQVEAQITSEI